MNIIEFESNFPTRIMKPLIKNDYTASYEYTYTPEDFITKMSVGSNSIYGIDKVPQGLDKATYSVRTMEGGIWKTNVSNTVTTSAPDDVFSKIKFYFNGLLFERTTYTPKRGVGVC